MYPKTVLGQSIPIYTTTTLPLKYNNTTTTPQLHNNSTTTTLQLQSVPKMRISENFATHKTQPIFIVGNI